VALFQWLAQGSFLSWPVYLSALPNILPSSGDKMLWCLVWVPKCMRCSEHWLIDPCKSKPDHIQTCVLLLLIDFWAYFSADMPEPDVASPAVEVLLLSRARRLLHDDFTQWFVDIFRYCNCMGLSPDIPSIYTRYKSGLWNVVRAELYFIYSKL